MAGYNVSICTYKVAGQQYDAHMKLPVHMLSHTSARIKRWQGNRTIPPIYVFSH